MNILKNLDIGCLKMVPHQRLSIQNECGHQMSFPCLLHRLGYILAELTDLLKQKSHRCVHNKFVFHQNVEPEQGSISTIPPCKNNNSCLNCTNGIVNIVGRVKVD